MGEKKLTPKTFLNNCRRNCPCRRWSHLFPAELIDKDRCCVRNLLIQEENLGIWEGDFLIAMDFPEADKYVSFENKGCEGQKRKALGWAWPTGDIKGHEGGNPRVARNMYKFVLIHVEISCNNARSWFFVRDSFFISNLKEWCWHLFGSGKGLVEIGIPRHRTPSSDYLCESEYKEYGRHISKNPSS